MTNFADGLDRDELLRRRSHYKEQIDNWDVNIGEGNKHLPSYEALNNALRQVEEELKINE